MASALPPRSWISPRMAVSVSVLRWFLAAISESLACCATCQYASRRGHARVLGPELVLLRDQLRPLVLQAVEIVGRLGRLRAPRQVGDDDRQQRQRCCVDAPVRGQPQPLGGGTAGHGGEQRPRR